MLDAADNRQVAMLGNSYLRVSSGVAATAQTSANIRVLSGAGWPQRRPMKWARRSR